MSSAAIHLLLRAISKGAPTMRETSQIAWLVGYNEVSSFSHACRRWTGKDARPTAPGPAFDHVTRAGVLHEPRGPLTVHPTHPVAVPSKA